MTSCMKALKISFIGNQVISSIDPLQGVIEDQMWEPNEEIFNMKNFDLEDTNQLILDYCEAPISVVAFVDNMCQDGLTYSKEWLNNITIDYSYYRIVSGDIERDKKKSLTFLHMFFYQVDKDQIALNLISPSKSVRNFTVKLLERIKNER